jgi:hypothetical protein
MPVKRLFMILVTLVVCWGCTKENNIPVGQGASPDGSQQLPVVNYAEIITPNAASDTPMTLQFTTESQESRLELFKITWYVDGTAVEGVNGNLLEPQNFKKGSQVEAEIIPNDGKRSGAPFRTKPVIVKNTPPTATSAALRPIPAFVGDMLSVDAAGSDRDNDTVTFEIQWMINNTNASGNEKGQLDTSGLKKKDRITAMVTPFDGENRGQTYPTNYLTLSNRNPDITSQPPSALQDGTYVYQVVAKDLDGDPLTYSLAAAPNGMTIDRNSGLIRWQPPVGEKQQQLSVKISVDDGDGGVTYQEFTINLEMR